MSNRTFKHCTRYILGNYKQILQYYIIASRKRLSKPQQGRNWLPFLTVQQLTKRVSSRGRYLRELKQLFRRCISLFLFGGRLFAMAPNRSQLTACLLLRWLYKRWRLFCVTHWFTTKHSTRLIIIIEKLSHNNWT